MGSPDCDRRATTGIFMPGWNVLGYHRAMRLILLLLVFSTALSAQDKYPTSAEIRAGFDALAKSEPDWCKIEELPGKVPGLYAVRLTRFKEPLNRPAIVILGSLRGDELSPAFACLEMAEAMLFRAKPDLPVRFGAWLQVVEIIFIPTPCAASRDLMQGKNPTAFAGVLAPLDDDRDLATDEDGPEDINSDGVISQLRIKRQGGRYRVSPRDARALIECAPGELGEYDVIWEGIDNDGDGQINEDPRGSITLANDFAIRWSDKQAGANRFPMLTAESRALADFFVAHPNIACAVNLRSLGGRLAVAGGPPQGEAPAGRGPRRGAPQGDGSRDKQVAEALQKLFAENTGFKPRQGEEAEGEGAGNAADWLYEACGAYAMNYYLARLPEPEKGEKPPREETPPTKEEAALLEWLKYAPEDCLEWKAFKHPTLGEVEIGGWKITARKDVKPALAREAAIKALDFVWELCEATARLRITKVEAKDLGDGTFKIRLTLSNEGALDYKPQLAAQSRIGQPLWVTLEENKKIELVSGARKQSAENINGGATATFEWVVRAKDPWDFMKFKVEGERCMPLEESKSPKGCEEWKE